MKHHDVPYGEIGEKVRFVQRRWRMLSMVAAIGLVLAACSSDGGAEQSDATVPGPSSTTTTSIDVSRVPDTITVEYAQAVMDELDRLLGDAIRELVAAGVPSDKFVVMLKGLYNEPEYARAEMAYGEAAAKQFEGYRRPPGSPHSVVREVVDSSKRCIVLRLDQSLDEVYSAATGPVPSVVQLFAKDAGRDPAGWNRTAWQIVASSTARSTQVPENPCK